MPELFLDNPLPGRKAGRLPLLLVCACAVLVYLNSFPGAFFMDDIQIVAQNPLVRQPDWGKIFASDYWGPQVNSGLYRPLTILSFALNRLFFGPAPLGFHLVNVLLHAAASGLFALVLGALGCGTMVTWGAALLFAVHPIHTEVVNMAVGRSELLVAVLLLLALKLALTDDNPRRHAMAAGCFGLALLAKEHAIIFLALLPAIDVYLGGDRRLVWRRRLPLYLLLAGVALAWLALRTFGVDHGDIPRDPYDPVYVPLAFLPDGVRVLSALKLQLLYLGKLLLPLRLQGVYAGEGLLQPVTTLLSPWGGLVALVICGWVATVWYGLRRRSLLALALLLYTISFAPTANVLFATGATFAERLAYLPSAWFCLGMAAGMEALGRCVPARLVVGVAAGCLLAYAGMTVLRNRDYLNPLALWQADVQSDPLDPHAWLLLATEFENVGELGAAERAYREALRLAPGFADAHNSYGRLLYQQGRTEEALREARSAVAAGQGVFGSAYVLLARSALELGRFDEALTATERLPEFQRRRYGLFWELRGLALEGLGDHAGALAAYEREITVEPGRRSDVGERIARVRERTAAHSPATSREPEPARHSRGADR